MIGISSRGIVSTCLERCLTAACIASLQVPLIDYGLRDYGTAQWEGGSAECDHKAPPTGGPNPERYTPGGGEMWRQANDKQYQGCCSKCGARRIDGQIGLEQSPAEFVRKMVEVFEQVRRVLRADGTCWVNIGDSYAGGGPHNNAGFNERYFGRPSGTDKQAETDSHKPRRSSSAGLKPKDLMLMPARVALALQEAGWWVRSDIIWCLSGGTRLYARTLKGDMPATLKDLVRLDPSTVQLWNGEKWTQVTAWTQAPSRQDAIELVLRSGERVGCTPDHVWPTQRGDVLAADLKVGDIIPTCTLPEPEKPVQPAALDDELVGWFVGLYLAEGFTDSKSIRISGHQKEAVRLARCREIAAAFGGTCTIRNTSENGATIRIHSHILKAVLETYVSGQGAESKHLTTAAWQRSNAFLNALLIGYLEGDAHYETSNNRYRLGFTCNDAWASDLRTLAARLGYSCRLRRCEHQMGERRFPGWRGEIRLTRSNHHNNKSDGEIVAIGRGRARKFWDVSVADEPHLFALASGVLTHNCKRAPMPESVTDRPTSAHEHVFLLSKAANYYYDPDAVRENVGEPTRIASKMRSPNYLNNNAHNNSGDIGGWNGQYSEEVAYSGRNMWNYWLLSPEPYAEAHFATFPTEIPRRAILAGTSQHGVCSECQAPWRRVVERTGGNWEERKANGHPMKYGMEHLDIRASSQMGSSTSTTTGWQPTCRHTSAPVVPATVLDPFCGAATTGLVATRLNRRFVGIELNPSYVEMGSNRILNDNPMFNGDMGEAPTSYGRTDTDQQDSSMRLLPQQLRIRGMGFDDEQAG